MPVDVNRRLDARMAKLLLHVGQGGTPLKEDRSEGMTQVMKTDLADTGLRQLWNEQAVVEVVWIENASIGRWKHQLVGDVRFASS